MSTLERHTAVAEDDVELSDDVFSSLPALDAPHTDAVATLATPEHPLADRLAEIQLHLDEVMMEASALRAQLRARAQELRAVADALESI